MKRVVLGADHAGFKLKEKIKKDLERENFVEDLGAYKFKKDDDYVDYAVKVARAIGRSDERFGILICGSSLGMCIAANKIKGVRAVSASDIKEAKLARQHNDANILCLSGWNLSEARAMKIVNVFLETKFSNASRHKRRIAKIAKLE